ncbi:hypothetical protein Mal35_54910 [Gimesia maris]|uniref:hypothetical protein n=1 Tax=Gimesia maris TaxID=122 RepID=UPI001188EAE9|nr:hypothetical protein [Gimesia maris]QDT82000.1 hypothetical protein Mal35_54910 [Gimesia maris]
MEITVFYAWQSDRPRKVNQFLIRDAAKQACERITNDSSNEWILNLDSDTQGEAGMCDIPNTILKKIKECDIFLADLTIVGKTDEENEKLLPNSNVVMELGYAACHLDFSALIGVINEVFGKVEGQVFDIKRRASLKYSVEPNATRNERNKACIELSNKLEEILCSTIEKVVIPRRSNVDDNMNEKAKTIQSEFADKVKSKRFHDYEIFPAVLTSVQFRPALSQDYPGVVDKVRENYAKNPKVDPDSIFWSHEIGVTELSLNGYILRADGNDSYAMQQEYNFNQQYGNSNSNDAALYLYDVPLQRGIVTNIYSHCHFLQLLDIKPPWQIGISLVGIKDFRLLTLNKRARSNECKGDFNLPLVQVIGVNQVNDIPSLATLLKPSLDYLCRHFGWDSSYCYTSNGIWNVR